MIFWYYTPTALAISYHLLPDAVIYDCMDELSLFKMAPPTLRELERHLFGRADVVFTGGHALFEAKRHYHHNIYEFPSSVDVGHFSKARSSKSSPQDAAHIKRPQIGFFGVIDERMDLELLAGMAAARRDWQFVMIGPVVKVDPGSLPDHDNIHWMGPRPYSALPDYIGSWDVGLMPFAINDATRFISPTKTLEFLAAGCPVVSTPITDVVTPYGVRGLVEIAATVGEALECTERLMLQEDRTQWLQAVDAYLAGRSWDATWAEMHAHIEKCLRHGRRRAVAQDLREAAYV
ncbi:MAG: glycosyltransferase [Beijerinckiaceae bacterium]|nr:glycosyltransferase [Beijerinckiaceae bacterium]